MEYPNQYFHFPDRLLEEYGLPIFKKADTFELFEIIYSSTHRKNSKTKPSSQALSSAYFHQGGKPDYGHQAVAVMVLQWQIL